MPTSTELTLPLDREEAKLTLVAVVAQRRKYAREVENSTFVPAPGRGHLGEIRLRTMTTVEGRLRAAIDEVERERTRESGERWIYLDPIEERTEEDDEARSTPFRVPLTALQDPGNHLDLNRDMNPIAAAPLLGRRVRVWSDERRAWWRPLARGYTEDRDEAGVFDLPDAWERTRHCGEEKQIYLELVKDERAGENP